MLHIRNLRFIHVFALNIRCGRLPETKKAGYPVKPKILYGSTLRTYQRFFFVFFLVAVVVPLMTEITRS